MFPLQRNYKKRSAFALQRSNRDFKTGQPPQKHFTIIDVIGQTVFIHFFNFFLSPLVLKKKAEVVKSSKGGDLLVGGFNFLKILLEKKSPAWRCPELDMHINLNMQV